MGVDATVRFEDSVVADDQRSYQFHYLRLEKTCTALMGDDM